MTPPDDARRLPAAERRRALLERIAVAPGAVPVAYVPGRVLVRGDAVRRVRDPDVRGEAELVPEPDEAGPGRWSLGTVADPLLAVELLRSEGLEAQLDHVFLAHGCDPCATAPHPSATYGWDAPAFWANPLRGNPLRGNPLRGNPLRGNESGDALMNSAMPAADRVLPRRSLDGPGRHPHVAVLDTGLAGGTGRGADPSLRPPLLDPGPDDPGRISGTADHPDCDIPGPRGTAAYAADGWLNPVAGHGTFIAGLVEQLAPGCRLTVDGVIGALGDVAESEVVAAIDAQVDRPAADRPEILSLSFGGSVLDAPWALRGAVARARRAGIVVVASAGNDGIAEPQYPAALPHVVAVGALGPDGPAPWSNYGGWVDACAPAVDLTSAFFAAFDGPAPMVNGVDGDAFAAWATWSGTSFAVPVVVAALAREMVLGTCDAATAVARVVHAPHLLRIPCLGTVVNL